MAKLTKTYIDKIDPPESGYDLHWDTETRGFGLRVTKDGKRTYIVQGRVNGKEARITIGAHGVFTVDQARDEAKEHLRNMKKGIDPRDVAKERAAETVTLRDVADAYKRDRQLKESSKGEIERHVTTTFEAWLKKPVASISREAVTKRFNEIKNHGLRGDGPAPAQANQGFSVLRALINYAIREYRKPDGSAIASSLNVLVSLFTGAWAAIKSSFVSVFDWIASKIDSVVGSVKSAVDWVSKVTGLGSVQIAASTQGSGAYAGATGGAGMGANALASNGPLGYAAAGPSVGGSTVSNSNNTNMTVPNINITTSDPVKAGQSVREELNKANRSSVRNGQSAVLL